MICAGLCGGVTLALIARLLPVVSLAFLALAALPWLPVMATTVAPLVWLAAQQHEPRRRLPLLAGEVLLGLLLALALSTGANAVRLATYRPAGDAFAARVKRLQSALTSFTDRHGCLPLTVGQLQGGEALAEGPTASPDPLTGRADTWILDPLDPRRGPPPRPSA